ncbi:hypothetical protein BDY21DRAFT_344998 [Lineolata rhizophorae]|uniref:Small ribosomal subunit protein uS10m n=1 Tax=Lineolata rhizophorae TaxID=578093 RepID=A0A6A6P0Y0_9PEZI|nr:hypothetical protein BDY21DRAFT_344998 [Lineolata rhizophorae]
MAAPAPVRPPFGALKRIKFSRPRLAVAIPQQRHKSTSSRQDQIESEVMAMDIEELAKKHNMKLPPNPEAARSMDAETESRLSALRLPRNVQAIYLRPLKREAPYGLPVCDLQLRSFSVRNLELFADFALRAAYYLKLPAKGPVPLPRITERWTVPRSNFVHKKSQENWERVTLRRLIQIQDGHPETVQLWLGFLRKWQYHGVGMKANVFEHEGLDVGKDLDVKAELAKGETADTWRRFGSDETKEMQDKVKELLESEPFRRVLASEGQIDRPNLVVKPDKTREMKDEVEEMQDQVDELQDMVKETRDVVKELLGSNPSGRASPGEEQIDRSNVEAPPGEKGT